MSFLKKFFSVFKSPETQRNYWIFVQCQHCKEILRGRVDLFNHLSIQYGEGKDDQSYYCRKVMIGGKGCYRPIEVEFWFDADRKLIDQTIKGGIFVTEQEYQKHILGPENTNAVSKS